MGADSDDHPGLLRELKRRRVLRAGLLYVVAAWAVIQAADVIFPHLGLPGWTVRLVIALAALGFPLALVLSWAFDLGPRGLERTPVDPGSGPGSWPGRAQVVYGSALLGLVVAAVALTLLAARPRAPVPPPSAGAASIAVLPFANMSSDPENEYFSDGLTEELLNALARIDGLRVAARTSSFAFKGHNEDVSAIAQKLRVRTVLEGSVRRSGTSLRITAQLIDASTGYHLWSKTYDRELRDVFAIQEEIARSIAETLTGTLLGEDSAALARHPTRSVEAYDLYLKGRASIAAFHDSEASVRRAIDHFESALAADPTFALAHAGLATAYIYLAEFIEPDEVLPRAKAAALRALELDSSLVETRLSLAEVRLRHDWDWQAAEEEIRQAILLGPEDPAPRYAYAELLQISRRANEAAPILEEALRLDSLRAVDPAAFSGVALRQRAALAYESGDYSTAIRLRREAVAEQPSSYSRHWLLGLTYLAGGPADSAVVALERADALFDGTYPLRTHLGVAYARVGRTAEAEAILSDLLAYSEERYVGKDQVAALYLALGDTATALDWLEQAFDDRHWWLPELNNLSFFEGLRGHPRYRALLRRMNAPGL